MYIVALSYLYTSKVIYHIFGHSPTQKIRIDAVVKLLVIIVVVQSDEYVSISICMYMNVGICQSM